MVERGRVSGARGWAMDMADVEWVPGLFAHVRESVCAVGRTRDGAWVCCRRFRAMGSHVTASLRARVERVNAAGHPHVVRALGVEVCEAKGGGHVLVVVSPLEWSRPLSEHVASEGGRLSVEASARVGCDLAHGLQALTEPGLTATSEQGLGYGAGMVGWDPWVEARRLGDGRCHVGEWVAWMDEQRALPRWWSVVSREYTWSWCHGPEVIERRRQDARSWVFTVAAAVFRCITGRTPRKPDTRLLDGSGWSGEVWAEGEAERVGCPAALAEVLEAALDPSPEARPADLERLIERLEPFAQTPLEEPGEHTSARLAWCRAMVHEGGEDAVLAALLRMPEVAADEAVADYVWGHLGGGVERALGAPGGLPWSTVVAALVTGAASTRDVARIARDPNASVTARLRAARLLAAQTSSKAWEALEAVEAEDGAQGRVWAQARACLGAARQTRSGAESAPSIARASARWEGEDVLQVRSLLGRLDERAPVVLVPGDACVLGAAPTVDVHWDDREVAQIEVMYAGEGRVEVSWGRVGAMCAPVVLRTGTMFQAQVRRLRLATTPELPGVLVYGTPSDLQRAHINPGRWTRLEPGEQAPDVAAVGVSEARDDDTPSVIVDLSGWEDAAQVEDEARVGAMGVREAPREEAAPERGDDGEVRDEGLGVLERVRRWFSKR